MGGHPLSDSDQLVHLARATRRPVGHRTERRFPQRSAPVHVPSRRVVIVDDDEWVRRGRAEALRESGWADAVVALDHDAALVFGWAAGDTLLVDAYDPGRAWDRYVCIEIAAAVRASDGGAETTVIVLSDGPAAPALRDRAAEAGADFVIAHEQLRDVASVLALLSDPGSVAERLVPGRRGLTAAVHLVDQFDAHDLFDGRMPQKQSDLTRRNIITMRQRLARVLGLTPTPRLRELVEVINEARGADGG